jgi:hypothetical protein
MLSSKYTLFRRLRGRQAAPEDEIRERRNRSSRTSQLASLFKRNSRILRPAHPTTISPLDQSSSLLSLRGISHPTSTFKNLAPSSNTSLNLLSTTTRSLPSLPPTHSSLRLTPSLLLLRLLLVTPLDDLLRTVQRKFGLLLLQRNQLLSLVLRSLDQL